MNDRTVPYIPLSATFLSDKSISYRGLLYMKPHKLTVIGPTGEPTWVAKPGSKAANYGNVIRSRYVGDYVLTCGSGLLECEPFLIDKSAWERECIDTNTAKVLDARIAKIALSQGVFGSAEKSLDLRKSWMPDLPEGDVFARTTYTGYEVARILDKSYDWVRDKLPKTRLGTEHLLYHVSVMNPYLEMIGQ